MRQRRRRHQLAAVDDFFETLVRGDLPAHRHIGLRHAAIPQRIGRKPCPQHDRVWLRITGGDAERERIALETRLRDQVAGGQGQCSGERGAAEQECAAGMVLHGDAEGNAVGLREDYSESAKDVDITLGLEG